MKHLLRGLERILPMLFWILLMLAFNSPGMTVATLFAAFFHELGHILVLFFLKGGSITLPRAVVSGLRLGAKCSLSYKEELAVAAAGPAINLLLFTFLSFFFTRGNTFINSFATINLLTAISNLIPARGYDGYRIIECIISIFSKNASGERCYGTFSLIFSALTVFLSLGFILIIDSGYWIFVLFFFNLTAELSKRQKQINCENK